MIDLKISSVPKHNYQIVSDLSTNICCSHSFLKIVVLTDCTVQFYVSSPSFSHKRHVPLNAESRAVQSQSKDEAAAHPTSRKI